MLNSWFSQHTILLSSVAAISVALLLFSIVATPWLVARLPADYLLITDKPSSRHPVLILMVNGLRTLLGGVLVLAGIMMLILPGPGIITLLLGLSVARFPGKRRLLHYVVSQRSVFDSLNWMRQRHGKVPLLHPHHHDER